MNLNEKVMVITGGSKGIGRELVTGYSKAGATVVFTDIDVEAGRQLEREMKERGRDVCFLPCDVRDVGQIEGVFTEVAKVYSKLDILINNAGLSRWISPYEITVKEWDDIIDTNLRAYFFCAREAAKIMKLNKKGAIVNIASTRALMSEPNSEAYAASKGGVISLTHALAASFQEEQIRVNAISPGWIVTGSYEELRAVDHEQHFSKRVGKPEDILRTCFFLTDESNDFITGTNITVDGGMTKKMIYEE